PYPIGTHADGHQPVVRVSVVALRARAHLIDRGRIMARRGNGNGGVEDRWSREPEMVRGLSGWREWGPEEIHEDLDRRTGARDIDRRHQWERRARRWERHYEEEEPYPGRWGRRRRREPWESTHRGEEEP